jgi:Ion channel
LLILATLVFQLAAPEQDWARLTAIAIQGLTLLAALRASRVSRAILRLAAVVVAVAILSAIGAYVGFGELGPTAARLITVMLVALAPPAIARGVIIDFRREHEITLHTMFGVLCIYLLIGSVFAFVFGVVDSLGSAPFFAQPAAANSHNLLYFSFVTITTTGYGDLTAGTDVGRSLAIAEALVGQIYLVTVVAAIVGGLGRRAA